MFNFFKKKAPEIKIIDNVYMSAAAKFKAMLTQWSAANDTAFVFWFEDSLRDAATFFAAQTTSPVALLNTREATGQLAGMTPVFAEHYPVRSKELELFGKMNLSSVQVLSSLDEPVFQQFGADKIIQVMQQLGMKEEESIEHKMVTNAIQKMQEKLEKKIVIDQSARSQAEWLQKNYNP